MTGAQQQRNTSKRRGGEVRRQSAKRYVRADQVTVAARLLAMAWEIAWTVVDEFVWRRTGPGRLL